MLKCIIVFCLLIFSVISDIKHSNIRNFYVIPVDILGLSINTVENGIQGLKFSLIGMVVPIFLLWLLFYARLIGAGDIKLFSAIGAIFGCKFILNCMAYSFVFAGAFSIIFLLRNKIENKRSSQLEALSILKLIKKIFYDFYMQFQSLFLMHPKNIQSIGSKHIIKLSPYVATGVCLQILLSYN